MRLWKALHKSFRGTNGVRRADGPRARLEVEALDQRLLPSSVPNLAGVVMQFTPSTSLQIRSVQDQGGGKGTFIGVYKDSQDSVSTFVSGSMAFKGMTPDPIWGSWGPTMYDFGVTFSGSTASVNHYLDSFTDASGSGDVYVSRVSANSTDYTNAYSPTFAELTYAGTAFDSREIDYPYSDVSYSYGWSGHVSYTNYWPGLG